MPHYEHVFLARQDLSQAPGSMHIGAAKRRKIVEDNDGKVVHMETWGLKSLAYKIQKNRKAHYVMLRLDAPTHVVAELERQTRINEDVIRYMTIRVEAHEEGPSVMMRKPERDARGRGPRRDRDDRDDRDGGRNRSEGDN
ncbi:MAG: 30S ribosomal protein S6 [Parasphingorhabdus sp.]|nr:30S ribosomal protein S6 [Parasphingorhabdus sp.]